MFAALTSNTGNQDKKCGQKRRIRKGKEFVEAFLIPHATLVQNLQHSTFPIHAKVACADAGREYCLTRREA